MKKQILTLSFALCAAFGYSQNSNPWPTSGNVGIGTSSPTYKLTVLGSPSSPIAAYTETIAGIGKSSSRTLLFQHAQYLRSLYSVWNTFKIQYMENTTTSAGFIEYSRPLTTNTTKAAVSFGNDGVELMRINQDGKVRIANGDNDIKTPNGYKLFVEDGILTEKVKVAVKTTTDWADYVFAKDYKLMPLSELEKFTRENNHLPNVLSAAEMVTNGLDVAKMDAKLLEKIEELTLYLIEQNKLIEQLKADVRGLKEKKQ